MSALPEPAAQPVDAIPLSAHIGAEIRGIDFDRQLYRTTLVGDVPVGPDGRASVALEGSPVEAAAAVALN